MAPPLPFIYPTIGAPPAPHLVSFTVVRGLEDMLSSPLGQHILSYEPPRGFAIPPFAMYDVSSDPYYDAPFPGGPVDHRQPTENLYVISGDPYMSKNGHIGLLIILIKIYPTILQ